MAAFDPSEYLDAVLFRESSSAIERLFEEQSGQLFQTAGDGSFVEICVQERRVIDSADAIQKCTQHARNESDFSDIDFSCQGIPPSESLTEIESVGVFLDKGVPQAPSRYIGENDIYLYTVSDTWELDRVAANSQDCFRICFIRQRHPNSRLLMSRELFDALISTFDVFPRFRDYIAFFGFKRTEQGLGPPQLRWRAVSIDTDGPQFECRRDLGFECAYELRYVEPNPYYIKKPWRLRQTAVYHRYKFESRVSTWVVVSASSNTESSIDRYIKSAGDLTKHCPFDIHLLIVEAGLSNWRPYIVHLTDEIVELSGRALAAAIDEKDSPRTHDIQARHRLKGIEDELIDILLVLDSLHDTIEALLDNYTEYVRSSSQLYTGDHDTVSRAFQAQAKDIAFSRKSIESLQTRIQATNTLLSSLLALRNNTSLKQIAQEEHRENAMLRQLNEKSANDSSAVKVLSVIILVYLPIMVVCSFFSTRFVSVQANGQSREIVLASNAWVFIAIAAPLTLLTLIMWYVWVKVTVYKRRREHASKGFVGMSKFWTGHHGS